MGNEASSEVSALKLTPEFRPRDNAETVEIPIQIEDGEIKMKVDSPDEENEELPKMRDGTTGTLTVLRSALEKDEDERRLVRELEEIILPTTQKVWFRIKIDHRRQEEFSDEARKFLRNHDLPKVGNGYRLVPTSLHENLWLRHRGTKNPELKSCRCSLPGPLQEEIDTDRSELGSINQAYTRLSEIFEVQRSTHTGNVYGKGFMRDLARGEWMKIGVLRRRRPGKCIWQERPWPRPWWTQKEAGEDSGAQTSVFEARDSAEEDGPKRRWATFDAQVADNEWEAKPTYITCVGGDKKAEEEGEEESLEDVLGEFRDRRYDTYDPGQHDNAISPPFLSTE